MFSISLSNKKDLDKICVHDGIFTGFEYDYEKRQIRFTLDLTLKQPINFCLLNVIWLEIQSCSFWHGGMNVMWISIEEKSPQLDQLLLLQEQKKELYAGSYLDKGIEYMTVEIQLNSGDTILAVCEKLECDIK